MEEIDSLNEKLWKDICSFALRYDKVIYENFDAASLLSKEQRKRLGFPNFIVLQDDFAKEEN